MTGTIIRSGTTATLHPSDNPAGKGEVYRSGYAAGGTTGAAFATSTYGSGRVAYWGDSSPIDDGTGQSGNDLYDGWNDPAGSDATLALNATAWLGGHRRRRRRPARQRRLRERDGAVGAQRRSSRHDPGARRDACTAARRNQLVDEHGHADRPRPGRRDIAPVQTYLTTQETGTTAYDTLVVKVGTSTVASLSNAGTKGSWISTSTSLAAYAGQTVTLSITATNGTKLPTTFWVDDISIG